MNTKAKIAIFLAAVLIAFVGFNMMVSPAALELIKPAGAPVYHYNVTVTASLSPGAEPVVHSAS